MQSNEMYVCMYGIVWHGVVWYGMVWYGMYVSMYATNFNQWQDRIVCGWS